MEYGDGSIYQRSSDKKWVAKYAPKKGVKPKIFYGKTQAEVKRKLKEYKRSPEALVATAPKTVSVQDYFTTWLHTFKRPVLKPVSYDRLESTIKNHIFPAMGMITFSQVTAEDCQSLLNDLSSEGYGHSTVKKVYDALNACFKHAAAKLDITFNPMVVVGIPSKHDFAPKKEVRALTVEEQSQLETELARTWASSGNPVYKYKDGYILALNTGLREGELVALDKEDVDLEAAVIHVHRNALYIKERDKEGNPTGKSVQVVQETPKTDAGTRDIPLNQTAIEAIKRLQNTFADSPYLLATTTGDRVHNSTLNKQLANAYNHAMIPNATVHTLRHTFATRLFEKGANVKDVSVILGHSSVEITYNTYIHVIHERKVDVVGLLDVKDNAEEEED